MPNEQPHCPCATSSLWAHDTAPPPATTAPCPTCTRDAQIRRSSSLSTEEHDALQLKLAQKHGFTGEWGWPGLGNIEVREPKNPLPLNAGKEQRKREYNKAHETSQRRKDSDAYEKAQLAKAKRDGYDGEYAWPGGLNWGELEPSSKV